MKSVIETKEMIVRSIKEDQAPKFKKEHIDGLELALSEYEADNLDDIGADLKDFGFVLSFLSNANPDNVWTRPHTTPAKMIELANDTLVELSGTKKAMKKAGESKIRKSGKTYSEWTKYHYESGTFELGEKNDKGKRPIVNKVALAATSEEALNMMILKAIPETTKHQTGTTNDKVEKTYAKWFQMRKSDYEDLRVQVL